VGDMNLPKLNMDGRPIANKYCEGKMKRTLKRELEVPELADREANRISSAVKIGGCESGTLLYTARVQKT